ncbi:MULTISPECIES: hypothetical protein [unclassified Haladaptatus]|uniref:hypothetical protein n=1 Tax=unclassified Haladaptatus TaxID=2622732 RepID=UPI002FCE5AF5
MVNSQDAAQGGIDKTTLAERFVEDETKLRWAKIATAVASSILAVIVGGYIRIVESLVGVQVWAVSGFGEFLATLVRESLGGSAALVIESWQVGFVEATQTGPFAPLVLTAEAIVILSVIALLWERRPYA